MSAVQLQGGKHFGSIVRGVLQSARSSHDMQDCMPEKLQDWVSTARTSNMHSSKLLQRSNPDSDDSLTEVKEVRDKSGHEAICSEMYCLLLAYKDCCD